MKSLSLAFFLGPLLYSFSLSAASGGSNELKITTAGGAYLSIFARIKEPFEKQTGIKLIFVGDVDASGTEDIFRLVESDQSEAGVTASNWRDIPDILKKKKVSLKDIDGYKYQTIGLDRTQLVLDKTNPKTELSDSEIKDIFLGNVVSWKSIGGPDLPIKIVVSNSQAASLHFFEQKMLAGQAMRKPDVSMKEITLVGKTVADMPGAIGVTSAIMALGSTALSPKHREIGRPVTLFTKSKPNVKVLKLIEWIRTEGQKYIVH